MVRIYDISVLFGTESRSPIQPERNSAKARGLRLYLNSEIYINYTDWKISKDTRGYVLL